MNKNMICPLFKLQTKEKSPKVVCFHWSGGNANSFKHWIKKFKNENIELYSVTWKGGDLTCESVSEVIRLVADEMINLSDILDKNSNVFFFGHSLGGLIAFELAKHLENLGFDNIKHLIVSAVKSPKELSGENVNPNVPKRHKHKDEELFDYIVSIGGLPSGVHPDFLKFALSDIKKDYKIFETYSFDDSLKCINCGLTTFGGINDSSVYPSYLVDWNQYTYGPYYNRLFGKIDNNEANHFYLLEDALRDEVIEMVFKIVKSGSTTTYSSSPSDYRRERVLSNYPFKVLTQK